jgi:RNA polymerase sigma-70 factor, ECF subfamily
MDRIRRILRQARHLLAPPRHPVAEGPPPPPLPVPVAPSRAAPVAGPAASADAADAADAAELGKPGFTEEALPWMDAVYRFALRLTRDQGDAEDLVQDTYLKAYRSWDSFSPGTNCRSWLFTICRNTHLHQRDRARTRREVAESELHLTGDDPSARGVEQRAVATGSPDDFFEQLLDEQLMQAMDTLPDDFHDVLVLSDLADLTHQEIGDVLGIPTGTVKSRLFRARRQVRQQLEQRSAEVIHE